MRKSNKKTVRKNLRENRIKSIPMPEVSIDELLAAAECAQVCSNYPEYGPGDNTLKDNV